jgi:hypothetical protein
VEVLRRFLRTLKPLRSATIDINGVIATYQPALDPKSKRYSPPWQPKTQGTKANGPTQAGRRRASDGIAALPPLFESRVVIGDFKTEHHRHHHSSRGYRTRAD